MGHWKDYRIDSATAQRIVPEGEFEPSALGCHASMSWNSNLVSLAGIGEVLRVPLGRPSGSGPAQERVQEIEHCRDPSIGRGPIAFSSMPFDRLAHADLVVPQIVLGQSAEGDRWIGTYDMSLDQAIDTLCELQQSCEPAMPQRFQVSSVVDPAVWRDRVVEPTRNKIRSGRFNKVVLARELAVVADEDIPIATVLKRLQAKFPTATVFSIDWFVGASPEMLVARVGDEVRAHPLAGTVARSSDPELDALLADELVSSTKNQSEHRITIDWLLDTLLPYCSYVDAEPEPSIVSLANVHHLGTRVSGRLSKPLASVLELVAALHPTPAVGGDPQGDALAEIAEVEPGGRGRYAAPVGWVDAAGSGEFAVGIRSATIEGNRASLWAGVGVVAGSDPQAELDETRQKFEAMLGALIQP